MNEDPTTKPLSRSECATIALLSCDLSQKEIAAQLGVSRTTVNTFAQRAFRKLGVHGPAAAALLHRDVHPWCGTNAEDFAGILTRIKTVHFADVVKHMTRASGADVASHAGRRDDALQAVG